MELSVANYERDIERGTYTAVNTATESGRGGAMLRP